jgi:hypothetical protein
MLVEMAIGESSERKDETTDIRYKEVTPADARRPAKTNPSSSALLGQAVSDVRSIGDGQEDR